MRSLSLICSVFFLLFLFTRCDKEESGSEDSDQQKTEKRDLSGLVEKGPFISGSTVTISELDEELNPTGRNFTAQITGDDGSFEVTGIDFASNFVQIAVDGFFFDEVKGELSSSKITLMGIADITDKTSVNVNLLTHLQRARVQQLIEKGASFASAKEQSLNEVLGAFGVAGDFGQPEDFSIIGNSEESNILLAVSTIMLNGNSEAQFTELLSQFSDDLKTDGLVGDESIKTKIAENSAQLQGMIQGVKENIEHRYHLIGKDIEVGAFEDFVDFDNDGVLNKDDEDVLRLIKNLEQVGDSIAQCYRLTYEYVRLCMVFDNMVTGQGESVNSSQWASIKSHDFLATDPQLEELWNQGYEIIYKVNNIMESLPFLTGGEEYKEVVVGECLVIRSLVLSKLENLFGAIPLMTESFREAMKEYSRSPREEVTTFIKQDLVMAIDKLGAVGTVDKTKVAMASAQALLARLCLLEGKWTEVAQYAQMVEESGIYSLTADYSDVFTSSSSEMILCVYRGEEALVKDLFTKGLFIPVFRYADIMMIQAEVAFRMGDMARALELINSLRARRDQEFFSNLDEDLLVQAYKDEFALEGDRFSLLKRFGLLGSELGLSEVNQVLPVPQSVIDESVGISQNPGY